jgi:hypothetical protein
MLAIEKNALDQPWRPAWYAIVPFLLGSLAGIIYIIDVALRWAAITNAPWQAMSNVSMYIVLPMTTIAFAWLAWVVPILGARDASRRFAHTPRGRLRVLHLLVWSSMLYVGVCAIFCLAVDPFDRLWNNLPLHWTSRMTLGAALVVAMIPLYIINKTFCQRTTFWFSLTVRKMQLCFDCKYDLRAKPLGPCPECGWEESV